jgi:hypothetical protein
MENTPKNTKKRKVRSWVWAHYKPSQAEATCTCNHCGELISTHNGTNKMKNHLLSHSVFKPESTVPSEMKKIKTENPNDQLITTKLYVSYFLIFC